MLKKSIRYRKNLYDIYMFSHPEHQEMLMGRSLHDLTIGDLEAFWDLVNEHYGDKIKYPRPRGYRPRLLRRGATARSVK